MPHNIKNSGIVGDSGQKKSDIIHPKSDIILCTCKDEIEY